MQTLVRPSDTHASGSDPGLDPYHATSAAGRIEGPDKVSGRARYSADVRLPGMLWAKILRSPHAHARIHDIDTGAAAALPGVHAVLCYRNAPDIPWYDHGRLFDRTVRFAGDEVAAVAADSEATAEEALRAIRVTYEPLPCVLDMASALAPGAPAIHGTSNRAGDPAIEQRGNPRRGLREAELIIDRVYTTQVALHNALEPHGCVALWQDERLTLYASTQGVNTLRCEVADKLSIPERQVRVVTEHMGGGFGAKQVAWKHDVIAALLARESARPVHLMLDRHAENLATGNRNATRQHLRIGAKRDGTLTTITARIEIQIGAYRAGGETSSVDGIYHSLYACRNVRTEQAVVYTNTGPAVAFRAPGYVEGNFALESALDELARALNIDPIELRLRNYAETDQRRRKPYTSPDSLRRTYARVSEAFGWRRYVRSVDSGPKRRGIGFAAHDWVGGGGSPPGKVRLTLVPPGRFRLESAAQDIGTGTRTALAQVCAQALGVDIATLDIALGDSNLQLASPTSAGSATLATLAPAIHGAADQVRKRVLQAAAELLLEPAQALELRTGRVVANSGRELSLRSLCEHLGRRTITAIGKRAANRRSQSIRTCGAQCVEVEVDIETGEVRVVRVVASHDCGRIVNRHLVASQVMGGVMQGIGFALTEARVVDPRSGVVLNANLEDYKLPTVADTPVIIHAALDLADTEANVAGVKGIGEPPIIPTAAAIANAIFDAVGVRLYNTPFSVCGMLEKLSGPPHARMCDNDEPR
ncbi:MAG: xanthine dehydrogenase family protein molybdopterin-binding subunit [Burkholderiales bacterium]|nr:xanthine dehydrogenase family protein molybdopterin-binding subunit [Burkholderiales bacterium]